MEWAERGDAAVPVTWPCHVSPSVSPGLGRVRDANARSYGRGHGAAVASACSLATSRLLRLKLDFAAVYCELLHLSDVVTYFCKANR